MWMLNPAPGKAVGCTVGRRGTLGMKAKRTLMERSGGGAGQIESRSLKAVGTEN
jgi:hypothetical protein